MHAVPAGWHYLDPHEDAEMPWWDIQDAVDQAVATGAPGLPTVPPVWAIAVTVASIVFPLLGTRDRHIRTCFFCLFLF